VSSTTKGFLAPRMTEAERDAIADPAIGLTVFQTDATAGYYYFDGIFWTPFSTGGGSGHWSLSGSNIYNTNAGNVGIGVSAPQAKLHLVKDAEAMRIQGAEPYITFYNTNGTYRGFLWQGPGTNMSFGTGPGSTGRVEFYNDLNLNFGINKFGNAEIMGSAPSLTLYNGSGSLYGEMYKSGDDFEVAAHRPGLIGTPGNLVLQTSIFTQFSTQIAGNVGIGTRTPVCKVHIAAADEILRLEGSGYAYMSFYDGSAYKGFLLSDGNNMAFGTSVENNTGNIWFYAGGAIRMMMLSNGNIGIGTQNPTHKLAVNGTIRTKEVIVETGWSDYVFEQDYQLRPLNEVAGFIAQHGRLPGIPSAEEVQSEGLKVGDAQRLMMEKIEELTLYVIALQEEIEALKQR